MEIGNILDQVQADIPELTETKVIYRAINRVIRDINSKYPGVETMEEVLKDVSETITEKTNDYSWDNDDHILTLSPYTREIRAIFFYNGSSTYELKRHNIQTIKDYESDNTLYSSKYMYARYGRNKIIFPSTLLPSASEDTDPILKIKYLKDIIPLTDSTNSDTEITIPLSLEQVLISGVLFYIYSSPKYSNDNQYKLNERAYFAGLADAKESEIRNAQLETKSKDYKY